MRHGAFAGVGLALGLVAACSEETIVLATVPSEDAGSAETTWDKHRRCLSTADCDPGTFCERHRCGDTAGTCEPFPVSCDGDERPVCGCNGITYWNDCLRRAAGVTGASANECVESPPCDDFAGKCPEGAVCAKLGGYDGNPPPCSVPFGHCWVLPATCPAPTRPDRWDECAPPDKALRCVDTCTAIRSERSFARAASCEP